MKLNVGCGRMVLDGWFNIDIVQSPKAKRPIDLKADVRSIPLEDGCADVLMALHVIEHFYHWEVQALLAEWKRLLKPGGKIILELPNLEAACRNYLKYRNTDKVHQMAMWPFYGDPTHKDEFMCHRWGYDPDSLSSELIKAGFRKVRIAKPETHGRRANRDMRVEAMK